MRACALAWRAKGHVHGSMNYNNDPNPCLDAPAVPFLGAFLIKLNRKRGIPNESNPLLVVINNGP